MHCISFLYLRNCENVLLGWKTDFYNSEKELQNRKEEKELVIDNKFDEKIINNFVNVSNKLFSNK